MSFRNFLWATHTVFLIIFSLVACGGESDYNYDYDDAYYEIEGTILTIVDSQSFLLDDILVIHGPSTRFEYGDASDLAVGRRVEVEGTRISSGTVVAREIEFEDWYYDDAHYEIEGTILTIVDSQSFLLDDILVIHGPSTRFEYGDASDLAVGRRVEVEGTRISSGTVVAREIEFEYWY